MGERTRNKPGREKNTPPPGAPPPRRNRSRARRAPPHQPRATGPAQTGNQHGTGNYQETRNRTPPTKPHTNPGPLKTQDSDRASPQRTDTTPMRPRTRTRHRPLTRPTRHTTQRDTQVHGRPTPSGAPPINQDRGGPWVAKLRKPAPVVLPSVIANDHGSPHAATNHTSDSGCLVQHDYRSIGCRSAQCRSASTCRRVQLAEDSNVQKPYDLSTLPVAG